MQIISAETQNLFTTGLQYRKRRSVFRDLCADVRRSEGRIRRRAILSTCQARKDLGKVCSSPAVGLQDGGTRCWASRGAVHACRRCELVGRSSRLGEERKQDVTEEASKNQQSERLYEHKAGLEENVWKRSRHEALYLLTTVRNECPLAERQDRGSSRRRRTKRQWSTRISPTSPRRKFRYQGAASMGVFRFRRKQCHKEIHTRTGDVVWHRRRSGRVADNQSRHGRLRVAGRVAAIWFRVARATGRLPIQASRKAELRAGAPMVTARAAMEAAAAEKSDSSKWDSVSELEQEGTLRRRHVLDMCDGETVQIFAARPGGKISVRAPQVAGRVAGAEDRRWQRAIG